MHSEQPQWQIIDQNIFAIAKRRSTLDAEEARWLRQGEAVKIWNEIGQPSMLAYLESRCGYTPHTAQERMRVARALGQLPEIEEALGKGELSYSAVRELTRVANAATEKEWLAAALDKNVRQIEDLVAGHGPGSLPDDPPDPALITYSMAFEMSADTFALMRQSRRQTAEDMGATPDDDTFLTMLGTHYLNGSGVPSGPRSQIGNTICRKCGEGSQQGAGVEVAVDAAAIELAECDAKYIGSLDAQQPERARTNITDAVRRLVWHRDSGRCRWPGCRSSRGIDIHHIVPQSKGGPGAPSNLILCCAGHHRAVHRGKISISGTADNLGIEQVKPSEKPMVEDVKPQPRPEVVEVAKEALVKMGFKPKQAASLIEQVRSHLGAKATLLTLVHEALRCSPR